jgi:uncharacterized protein (TIGR00106 family)
MTGKIISLGLQIVPKSETLPSYSLVDTAIEVIQQSGVKHQITPFETVMEGEYDQLIKIVEDAQKKVLEAGADECLVYIKLHYRKNEDVTFEEKNLNR